LHSSKTVMKFWYRYKLKKLKCSEFQILYNEWCTLSLAPQPHFITLCVFACTLEASLSVFHFKSFVCLILYYHSYIQSGTFGKPLLLTENHCTMQKTNFSFCSSFTVKHVNDYFVFQAAYYMIWGMRWCSWLRHCATNRNDAGSIPNGVTGIFHWHNRIGRIMALGSTQPLTEMSTRNLSWGVKAAGA
jgi:hypothetical protein